MSRIQSLVKKEFRQIRRTRAYFALIFVAPFMQLLIMGSAITNEVKNIPLVVVDEDRSPFSRELIRNFEAVPLFEIISYEESGDRALILLDRGLARAALIIPRDFERDIQRGFQPVLQVLIDGVDGNSAGVSLGYIRGVLASQQLKWREEQLIRLPMGVSPGAASLSPVSLTEVIPRFYYNPELESKLNFVPGLIGILLVMITTMMTAINIVREKEMGTLEQLLVTPLGSSELILGKIIPFSILGLLQFTMGMIAARMVFGIPVAGSIPLLYGMTFLFLLSTLGLGIFVSTITQTQQQAMFVAWFLMIFTMLLSGYFVPLKNIPDFIVILTYINPLRYFITVLREIYLKATPFRYLWREAAAMGGIGLSLILFASLRFHKRLK